MNKPSKTAPNAAENSDWRLANFLPYQLSIASNAVSSLIAERYRKRFGLKVNEWRVMAVLGDGGAQTQRALTSTTLMDKVAVNRACKVLEDRGLVQRVPNESDGRSHLLELTQEGQSIRAEVMPLALATEGDLFEGFDETERKQFRKLLGRMYKRAQALGKNQSA
jgi:DNA-binding MarR family transcriptional regulator